MCASICPIIILNKPSIRATLSVQAPIYKYLAYAGTIPFILPTLIIMNSDVHAQWMTGPDLTLHSYGLVIVAFMCGTHWGLYLTQHPQCPINLLVSSNILTLTCWFAYLSQHTALILTSQLCTFLILLVLDTRLYKRRILHKNYYEMRRNVTAIVVFALAINLALQG